MHAKKKVIPRVRHIEEENEREKKSRRGNVHQVLASGSSIAGSTLRRFTFRMNP